jgi:hypothetical protein
MFLAFLIGVGVVLGLTFLGAFMVKRNPDTDWEDREDRPIFGPGDHHF